MTRIAAAAEAMPFMPQISCTAGNTGFVMARPRCERWLPDPHPMQSLMFTCRDNLKIANSIVILDAVSVMNMEPRRDRAVVLFPDGAMLFNPFPVRPEDLNVAVSGSITTTSPIRVALSDCVGGETRTRAKDRSGHCHAGIGCSEQRAAVMADPVGAASASRLGALSRTESPHAPFHVPAVGVKRRAAVFASSQNVSGSVRLGSHRSLQSTGATPRVVAATPRLPCASDSTNNPHIDTEIEALHARYPERRP